MRAVRGVGAGLALPVAFVLGACAARDPVVSTAGAIPAGNWRIERQTDRITGSPLASAFLVTRTSSNSAVDFPQPASLHLSCFKQDPVVRIAFQFKIGSNRNAELGYRFDDKPGHEPQVRFVDDYKTVVIEDQAEVARFVSELASSNSLYLRIRSLNHGRSAAEFKLDGAPAAIEAALADCPVQPPKPAKPPAKPGTKPLARGQGTS
jgi:hypothetical protein